MKNILTLSILLLLSNCFSQNDTSFFDKNWNPCEKIKAEYYRLIQIEGANYIVTDYYINNNPQMKAVCSRIDTLVKNGKCTFYNKMGQLTEEGVYKENKETGLWIFNEYTKKGVRISSGFEKNNLLDSVLTLYFLSGNIYSTSRYLNDTLNGPFIKYREDGTIYSASNYTNGKLNGWYIEYRNNGVKKYEEEYYNGKTTGNRRLYFENGQVQGEFLWTKHKVDGQKIWYYEDGSIQSKVIFTNGKRKKIVRAGQYLE